MPEKHIFNYMKTISRRDLEISQEGLGEC